MRGEEQGSAGGERQNYGSAKAGYFHLAVEMRERTRICDSQCDPWISSPGLHLSLWSFLLTLLGRLRLEQSDRVWITAFFFSFFFSQVPPSFHLVTFSQDLCIRGVALRCYLAATKDTRRCFTWWRKKCKRFLFIAVFLEFIFLFLKKLPLLCHT